MNVTTLFEAVNSSIDSLRSSGTVASRLEPAFAFLVIVAAVAITDYGL
jgi:hypothetical protein